MLEHMCCPAWGGVLPEEAAGSVGPAGGGNTQVRLGRSREPQAGEGGPITGHKVPDSGGARRQATEDPCPKRRYGLYPGQQAGPARLRLTQPQRMSPALSHQVTRERGQG